MKVSDYIIDFLIKKNVTDIFGIPGGVVLELLYAAKRRTPEITPHLSYHEQTAAFAACGYAQASHRLGVAYATRGPGFTNMITNIADAYYDSIPVLFITAHSSINISSSMRIENDQEIDTLSMVSKITKSSVRIDSVQDVIPMVEKAYLEATSGRKGPVLLDFSNKVLNEELIPETVYLDKDANTVPHTADEHAKFICKKISHSERPVFLIGDGISQSGSVKIFREVAEKNNIPILSSRFSLDVPGRCKRYFGYIGSHAVRYSNFILSKSDLVISLGNRMAFPTDSESYKKFTGNKEFIRIDIDAAEFNRKIPNCINIDIDINTLLSELVHINLSYKNEKNWLDVCNKLKNSLYDMDIVCTSRKIVNIMNNLEDTYSIVCDVGNNEFWTSRAYIESGISNRIIFSKSFGALGCSLGKSIGVYYSTQKPVICFVGDQGFQMNIQELQFIARFKLPILIVLLNNRSSGMIRDREKQLYNSNFLLTTLSSGYSTPDFKQIARAYNIEYHSYEDIEGKLLNNLIHNIASPIILEIIIDEDEDIGTSLPKGNEVQNMTPILPESIYEELNSL